MNSSYYDFSPDRVLRFLVKCIIDFDNECWIWVGAKDKDGYGNFSVAKNKTSKAHRYSFALFNGYIPDKLQVDHKCVNPSCVNPHCLQLLHGKDNNYKSTSPSAINKRKTHCCNGHELSGSNIIRKNGRRICIICEKDKGRKL